MKEKLGSSEIIDLTLSNPSRLFENYRKQLTEIHREAAESWLEPYAPYPAGDPEARSAIANYYDERDADIDFSDIILTSSTSEAYSWLFKLHTRPGDTILTPQPSYPLFEHLCRLEVAEPRTYRFNYEKGWELNRGSIRRALKISSPSLLLIVTPNNPTGHLISKSDLSWVINEARDYGCGLVFDEVFVDYCGEAPAHSVLSDIPDDIGVPTYVLSGLSKVAGVPGAKLSWIAAKNTSENEREQLEFIADQYLSVSSSIQEITPNVLEVAGQFQRRVNRRLNQNASIFRDQISENDVLSSYITDGGWYRIIRFPNTVDERDVVLELLDQKGLTIQPGFLYDLTPDGHVVVSLLETPNKFKRGIQLLTDYLVDRTT
jgi:aspartate/methionine/tyrosine aminotransferase